MDGLHATLSPQRNIGRTVVNVSIRGADALLTSPGLAGFSPANLDFANAAKDGGPTNTEATALMDCMDVAPRCGPGKDGMGHMDGPSLFLPASRVISECSTQARNVCHGQGPTWIPILFPQSYLLHIYTIFYPPPKTQFSYINTD